MNYYMASTLNDVWYKYGRYLASYICFYAALIFWFINGKKMARSLCAASLRYGLSEAALIFYKKIIEKFPYDKSDSSQGVELNEAAARTIVVMWPTFSSGKINRGVIVVTFTRTFSYYLRHIDLVALGKYFHLVLEPSWSGYADPDIMGFVGRLDSVIVQASEIEDRVLLNNFPKSFIPVSFGASDWVDSRLFSKKEVSKIYDSIYIANTNPIKRVRRYLEAIKKIVESGKTDYVGCLVCASWGGAQRLVSEMVQSYCLKENIVLKFSLSRDEVIECLNHSKVNILLSYKEGSNRSLFEAIFCDVPIICIQENVGVNKSYINEFTGLLIAETQLDESLIWMKDNYEKYRPRSWALQNIEPRVTTAKLMALIANRSRTDLKRSDSPGFYVKTNNPEVSYFDWPDLSHKFYSERLLMLFSGQLNCSDKSDRLVIEQLSLLHHSFIEEVSKRSELHFIE